MQSEKCVKHTHRPPLIHPPKETMDVHSFSKRDVQYSASSKSHCAAPFPGLSQRGKGMCMDNKENEEVIYIKRILRRKDLLLE